MRKMLVEKQLYFDEPVNEISNLYVSEDLSYMKSDEGMKAVGPIKIMGECISNKQKFRFEELVDMDILAPDEKLTDEKFSMMITDFYAKTEGGECIIFVEFTIEGLKDEDKVSHGSESVKEDIILPVQTDEVKPLVIEDDIENENDQSLQTLEIDKEFEDLFEDDGIMYTSYQMVVCKEYDSYESIANFYHVDEDKLRTTNGNKTITPKSLIILP